MSLFSIKRGDTFPVLVVLLKDPPAVEGGTPPPHDLTGATGVTLRIFLSSGVYLQRTMTVVGSPIDGRVKYAWQSSDWGAAGGGTGIKSSPYTSGGLVTGPVPPLAPGVREHQMEYEAVGPGTAQMTFPNTGASSFQAYDTLRIWDDLGV